MNSYQLRRPDGKGSGVWACGKCHRVHLFATRGGKPVSKNNQEAAEDCCVPRNCMYCGKQTEPFLDGSFPRVHEACVPKQEWELPPAHASMANPFARLLYKTMSDLSERAYCAGWMSGNEYSLWRVLESGNREYGDITVSADEVEELQALAAQAGGWIFVGPAGEFEPQLVPLDRWRELHAQELERCQKALAALEQRKPRKQEVARPRSARRAKSRRI